MTGSVRPTSVGQRALSTGDRLLAAALEAFSTTGFDGTSVRQVERMAGTERGLVSYHFRTKQDLWNQAVDTLFGRFTNELAALRDALRDVSKRERASAVLMAYARFNSRHPEFFRILILEGNVQSERSERLAAHLGRALIVFNDLTDMSAEIPVHTAIRWFQIIGAAGTLGSLSAHAEQTFGTSLHDPKFIDCFAAALAEMALEGITGQDPDSERVRFLGTNIHPDNPLSPA